MTFDWIDYNQLSDELLSKTTLSIEEAYYRTAISRYYYGVFNIAKGFLIKNNRYSKPTRSDHLKVISTFKSSRNNRAENKLGTDLGDLWDLRKKSDYENTPKIDMQIAQDAQTLSQQIISNLQKINAL